MSTFTGYTVKKIPFILADILARKFHYLASTPKAVKFSFGLYDPEGVLRGMAMFGVPTSSKCSRPAFGNEKVKMLDLKRFWVDDVVPGNGESFFMGACLRQIKGYDAVVTYADPAYHTGRLYAACNFTYLGIGARNVEITIAGKVYHTGVLKHIKLSELKAELGDEVQVVLKPGKARYYMVIADARHRRRFLEALLSAAHGAVSA